MSDKIAEFLTRKSLLLIIVSYVLIVALLLDQLSILLIVLGFFCASWRIAVFTGRTITVNKFITHVLAVILTFAIISLTYPQGVLNVLTHLIVLGFTLKLLQLKSVRDVHFFINTGLALLALFLVFNSSVLMAIAAGIAASLLLAILLSMHGKKLNTNYQFKLLSKALLLSLPLAIVMFVVLPRLPPMWKMPLQQQAKTGLSDSVTPGSIAQLSKSSALAFRVSFNGELPQVQDRYWRALTLDQFNGKTWSQSASLKKQEKQAKIGKGQSFTLSEQLNSYQLILEPHYKHYLPSLDFANVTNERVQLSDYSLRTRLPTYKRQAFEIELHKSITDQSARLSVQSSSLTPEQLKQYLQLPDTVGNPKTIRMINKLRASGLDKYEILEQLLMSFNQDKFRYTLQPPLLGEQQVDDFLFTTQAGFCVHYASSYLFVARALNIPARMVAGYLGGEWDQANQFLTVRQYDAHAWVEIRKGGQWVRVDPTAYVSPERVEQGVMEGLDDQSEFLSGQYLSIHHWQNNSILKELRSAIAQVDYLWAVWVINYDNAKQSNLLRKLLANFPWLNLSMMILLLLASVTTITMLWIFKPWQRPTISAEDKIFLAWYKKVGEPRLMRVKGQTVFDYCQLLGLQNSQATADLNEFGQRYNQIKFQVSLSTEERNALIKALLLSKKLHHPKI